MLCLVYNLYDIDVHVFLQYQLLGLLIYPKPGYLLLIEEIDNRSLVHSIYLY